MECKSLVVGLEFAPPSCSNYAIGPVGRTRWCYVEVVGRLRRRPTYYTRGAESYSVKLMHAEAQAIYATIYFFMEIEKHAHICKSLESHPGSSFANLNSVDINMDKD